MDSRAIKFTDVGRTCVAAAISLLAGGVATFLCPAVIRHFFRLTQYGSLTPWYIHGIRFIVFTLVLAVPVCAIAFGIRRTGMALHKYRFIIGAGIVALSVALNISGSSMGMWNYWLGGDMSQGVVWGTPRPIRTDEYIVGTPFAFSQGYNHYGYFNPLFGNKSTDMFIIKDAPVWVLAELFRPFHWGYLLLGSARGLAFYWSARLVALFLASYQVLLMLTNNEKETGAQHHGLCCLGASMIAFAPLIQWWFAVNSLPEMLIAVFTSVCCFDRYLADTRIKARALYAAAILACAGMFILSLYPAWQIPLAYVLLALIVGVVAKHWGAIHITKADIAIAAALVVAFAVIMTVSLIPSMETIMATLHTEYPGSRQSTGGGYRPVFFFSAIGTLMLPFREFVANSAVHNATEAALFIDLFPMGIALSLANMVKRKKIDVFSVALIAVVTMLGCFACIGFPLWLSKIMLLTPVTPNRIMVAFAICNILLLMRAAAYRAWNPRMWQIIVIAVIYAGISAVATRQAYPAYIGALTIGGCCVMSILFVCSFLAEHKAIRLSAGLIAGVVLFISGMSVNPVQYSTDPITKQPVIEQVQALQSKYDGMWAASGERSPWIANLMVANGVKTFNSLQVVPDMVSWKRIDPTGQWKTAYNRFAYVGMSIDDSAVEMPSARRMGPFELVSPDDFIFHPTPRQLDDLGVKNVLATEPLDSMHFPDGYSFVRIGRTINGRTPYRLVAGGR
ncbi:DUF7657 domain-containing protein [Bifidobacterium leontopitheci]|uniref:YfhO family protein n=1 Tax=Bifidobacterium leontopitheci TaxID=2650774 RepID=A0A6I1GLW2_9BIFI|nr:hypothetical protein [Bifidobacterium leontopitheci]KAB7790337.1 hypothetical protein F7D09_1146 [Bifidobacterium leontopitheci]